MKNALFRGRTHDGQAWRGEKEWEIRKPRFYYFSVLSVCTFLHVSPSSRSSNRDADATRGVLSIDVQFRFDETCTVWYTNTHACTRNFSYVGRPTQVLTSAGVLLIRCGSLSLSVYVSVHLTRHLSLSSRSSSCTTQAVSGSLLVRQRKKSEAAHSLRWIL